MRAAGDSRTPLVAVSLAAVCNIILDLLFVVALHLGVFGAALATLLSQLFSAGYCLWAIRRSGFVRLGREDFRMRLGRLKGLLFLGLPMGLQNVITGLGGVAVQSVINGFGTIFVAGFTAANKLYGLFETAAVSYSYAVVSYTGQNAGAGDKQRVKKGFGAAHVFEFFTACHAGGLRFFPDEENQSDGRILGRSLRVAFGGCIFVPLSVVGVQTAVHDAEENMKERD